MNERIELLEGILKTGVSPILLEDIKGDIFENAVILEGDSDISEFNGHYEGADFIAPIWYQKLVSSDSLYEPILVIKDINKVPCEEQKKFIEILKYKKVSTFDLPKNCIIIVTASNLKENKIDEEVYSLMAHI